MSKSIYRGRFLGSFLSVASIIAAIGLAFPSSANAEMAGESGTLKPALPFSMPESAAVKGYPGSFRGADVEEIAKLFPKGEALKSLAEKYGDVYSGRAISDPDRMGAMPGIAVPTLAAMACRSANNCYFVGKLTETAPVVAQSNPIDPGSSSSNVEITLSTSSSKSTSFTQSTTIGGSVTVGVEGGGANGSATGKYEYTQSVTDTSQFGESFSEKIPLVYPANKYSSLVTLAAGGEYKGYVFWEDKRSGTIEMAPVTGIMKKEGWKASVVRGLVSWDPVSKKTSATLIDSGE